MVCSLKRLQIASITCTLVCAIAHGSDDGPLPYSAATLEVRRTIEDQLQRTELRDITEPTDSRPEERCRSVGIKGRLRCGDAREMDWHDAAKGLLMFVGLVFVARVLTFLERRLRR